MAIGEPGPEKHGNGPASSVLTAVIAAAAIGAISPGLGITAHAMVLALILTSLGIGRLVCRALRVPGNPFLDFVIGFAVLSHALLTADLLLPGAHWQVAAVLGLASLPAWRGPWMRPDARIVGLAVLVGAFTLVWNHDVAARLAHFHATGIFDFWVDGLLHAATVAQFGSPNAIGRGMMILADVPHSLYHTASYMPPALLTASLGMPPLETALLAWLPLGTLVMACGIAALGLSLAGPVLAALSVMGLALVPAPEQLPLGNGYLGFAWLLEASPGTSYSVGIACAAAAALVRWMRHDGKMLWGPLTLASSLTAACFLTRVNTFVLLAPAIGLAVLAGWPELTPRRRLAFVCVAIAAFVAILVALSWPALRDDPLQFLFGYLDGVHRHNGPSRIDGLQAEMVLRLGRIGAGLVDLPLTLLGTLGPWLPAFLLLAFLRRRCRAVEDALPWLLLLVAMLEMLLAPTPRNGFAAEFRHRAGPLLVSVIAVWSLHWVVVLIQPRTGRLPRQFAQFAWPAAALLSLAVLSATIGTAKRPAWAWGAELYGTRVAPGLMELAPAIARKAAGRSTFAVANQPANLPAIDDAGRLTALTGVPAYLSRPGVPVGTGGAHGEEAQRRLAVIRQLAAAPNLDALRALMRTEGIAFYVTTSPTDLPFDPERRDAIARSGDYALYGAIPGSADIR